MYISKESTVINNGNIGKFVRLQRRVRQCCPLSAYLVTLDIENLAIIIIYNDFTGIQMYNILYGNAPSYLCKPFSVNDTIHNHNTRNSHSLHIPKYKIATG